MRSSLVPAAGLFLLAPLVAEFLLGNLPISTLYALLVLAPLYGGGALLIRELARRRHLGWPTVFVLALAYGVLEEGLTTMSLFNPNYANQRLLDYGYVGWLGTGLPWAMFVVGLHTIWSISVPIAAVETLAGEHAAARPWLGRSGLTFVALLFVFGIIASTAISVSTYHFVATPAQLFGSVVVVGLLIWVALRGAPRLVAHRSAGTGPAAPHPLLVTIASLAVTTVFKQLPHSLPAWAYVAALLAMAVVTAGAVCLWSQQPGWGAAHRLALAAGALLTYAWTAFPETPVLPASPLEDLVGNCVFAAGALLLIGAAAWQLHERSRLDSRVGADPTTRRPGEPLARLH
jgi:hypothetical protein